ncbi:MAG: prepilin-type N-terminal cleavage/methylation domain-containing protein [Verrucomicrobiota bacterium]
MNTRAIDPKIDESGFTLVEVMVAAMLVAIFLVSIFELNAMCLRYIDTSKESLAALQSVQDRAEALRNVAFADLTNVAFVRDTVMPANYTPPSDVSPYARPPTVFSRKATEVVSISQYPTPNGVNQFTRSPNGTVTTVPGATNLGMAQLVKVDVLVSWYMTMGGRYRSEKTSSIISNGTKK